jgi:PAS domain S-box-containing protein
MLDDEWSANLMSQAGMKCTVLDYSQNTANNASGPGVRVLPKPRAQQGVSVVALDAELRVVSDSGFLRALGRSALDARGRSFPEFLHPGLAEHFREMLNLLVIGKRSKIDEQFTAVRVDGSPLRGTLSASAVHGATGRTGVVVCVRANGLDQEDQAEPHSVKVLTAMDARILEGAAAGISTVQLASQLYLSRQGIEYHIGGMLRKFRVANRPALVSKAYSLGILGVGSWPPRVRLEYVK